jgi:hypothetical protein
VALPIILLAIAALLTVLFVPVTLTAGNLDWMAWTNLVIALLLLSMVRASVTAAGLLSMKVANRSGIMGVLPLCAAVFFIEAVSLLGHLVTATSSNNPAFRFGFEAAASATFIVLLGAAVFSFRGSSYAPKAIWFAATFAAVTFVAGAAIVLSHGRASAAAWVAKQETRTSHREQQVAAIAAVPPDAPIEALLPFAASSEEREVTEAAKWRIAQSERALEQLKAAYNGPHGSTARAIFQDVEIKQKQLEVRAIPKSAGLAAVLRFNKFRESPDVRALVTERIAETEDAESQLVKALNGPFAIQAIRGLCHVKRQPLQAESYAAAFAAASKIAARFDRGRPPEAEVEDLMRAVGSLAYPASAVVIENNRRELRNVYEMGKRAEERHKYSSHYYVLEKPLGLR